MVVAACKQTRGIGQAGSLPWRLKGDMAFFKQLTRSTSDPLKRNAVIMGRKTWQSIPPKFRPLDDRLNVVLSRNPAMKHELQIPDKVLVAESLEQALELLSDSCELGSGVETVYVIGGGSVYAEALNLRDACGKIHLTEVSKVPPASVDDGGAETEKENPEDNGGGVRGGGGAAAAGCGYECDAFFPELGAGAYVESRRAPPRVEGGASFEFVTLTSTGIILHVIIYI